MQQDLEHLRLLSIFHYIFGALTGLFSCIPIIHLVIGVAFLTSPDFLESADMPDDSEMRIIGLLFVVVASFVIILGFATALCAVLTGRFLSRQTHYVFCVVIAVIECLSIPFGTILGVFTLVVLSRESVKAMFGRAYPPPPMPGPAL